LFIEPVTQSSTRQDQVFDAHGEKEADLFQNLTFQSIESDEEQGRREEARF